MGGYHMRLDCRVWGEIGQYLALEECVGHESWSGSLLAMRAMADQEVEGLSFKLIENIFAEASSVANSDRGSCRCGIHGERSEQVILTTDDWKIRKGEKWIRTFPSSKWYYKSPGATCRNYAWILLSNTSLDCNAIWLRWIWMKITHWAVGTSASRDTNKFNVLVNYGLLTWILFRCYRPTCHRKGRPKNSRRTSSFKNTVTCKSTVTNRNRDTTVWPWDNLVPQYSTWTNT